MAREERELTDALMGGARTAVAPQRPATGRPNKTAAKSWKRSWLLRTGAPWRDLPDSFGPWRTVASRFAAAARACSTGCWPRSPAAPMPGELDWLVHYVDGGSVVRAHQHAAGARRQPSVADRKGEARRRRMRLWGAVAAG